MPFARARAAVLLLFAFVALASAWYWGRLGIPVELAAAPGGRISCVSYAPYRKPGESPFTPGFRVSAERIDEDLKALSRRFDCVRTYSVGQGLDQVPTVARKYGMKVLLGAWLSRDSIENAEELALAIRVANREHDAIRAIVVGNEVLLRGELPQRTLAEHLRMVRTATGLPVTYADVWEFWLKYREVAPAVDFITIHILPYWEDEPVAIEHAIEHVDSIFRRMQAAFPGREFLIGETGWPSEGRQRWQAVPSRVNEARFFREFLTFVERTRLPYNVIEAFDQPWKRKLEGTVGGYWGLYDDALNDKFGLAGPVVEEPRWWIGPLAGLAGALAFAGYATLRRRSPNGRSWAAIGFCALAGFSIAALGAAQVRHFVFANRDLFEWVLMGGATAIGVVTSVMVCDRIAQWLAHPGPSAGGAAVGCAPIVAAFSMPASSFAVPSASSSAFSFATSSSSSASATSPPSATSSPADALSIGAPRRANGVLQGFWLVAITIVNLLLVFDARYRDFPTLLFAPVIVSFAALAIARGFRGWRTRREVEERLLVVGLVVAAVVVLVQELPINASADLWVLLCVAFAAAAWTNAAPRAPQTSGR